MASSHPRETHDVSLTREQIARLHAMRDVPIDAVWALLERCPLRTLAPSEVLLYAGQANDRMHLVLEGELSVRLGGETDVPIATLRAGDAVGELSVIDKKPASAFVVAEAPSRLLTLNEEAFFNLVEASHAFSRNMLLVLASRMRRSNETLGTSLSEKQRLEQAALIDGLTGLFNRRWINDVLERLLQRTRREGKRLPVFMFDVDHFKRWNDTYGHPVGDAVLALVARTTVRCMRPTDLVARYGGEEFVVALPTTDLQGAKIAAERLRKAISEVTVRSTEGAVLPQVTVSLGVAESDTETNITALLARADARLYEAKRNGRNRVEG